MVKRFLTSRSQAISFLADDHQALHSLFPETLTSLYQLERNLSELEQRVLFRGIKKIIATRFEKILYEEHFSKPTKREIRQRNAPHQKAASTGSLRVNIASFHTVYLINKQLM